MQDLERNSEGVLLGVPSKGRLHDHVLRFLERKGLTFETACKRSLQARCRELPNLAAAFLHPKDIPLLVADHLLDVGFSGLDLIEECGAQVRPVIRLNAGYVRLSLAVPHSSAINHPCDLRGLEVASPYPRLAQHYFKKLMIGVRIRAVSGASEGLPHLGVADAVVDVMESGASFAANGLKVIDGDIFRSECVALTGRPEFESNHRAVNLLLRRLAEP